MKKTQAAISLLYSVTLDVIKASFRIAYDVVTPQSHRTPAIVAVPLVYAHSDLEIALLVLIVTFTPGSLVVKFSKSEAVIYVHCMFAGDREIVTREIQEKYEKKIVEFLQ